MRAVPALSTQHKVFERVFAAALLAIVLVVNPVSIRVATARADVGFRFNAVIIVIDLWLIFVAGALVTRGWHRKVFFYSVMVTFPLAVLASIEGAAIALRLADRIAIVEDRSVIAQPA